MSRVAIVPGLLALLVIVAVTVMVIVVAAKALSRRRSAPASQPSVSASPRRSSGSGWFIAGALLAVFAGFGVLATLWLFSVRQVRHESALLETRSAQIEKMHHASRVEQERRMARALSMAPPEDSTSSSRTATPQPTLEVSAPRPQTTEPSITQTPVAAGMIHFEANDDLPQWTEADALQESKLSRPPWVDNAGGSRPGRQAEGRVVVTCRVPGAGGKIPGYSQIEVTEEEAVRQAVTSAARQLRALLVWEVRKTLHTQEELDELLPFALAFAEQRVPSLELERYVEAIPRDYATLYRAAVLVRSDEPTLRNLGHELRNAVDEGAIEVLKWRKTIIETLIAGLGLTVVMLLLYCFLNAGTKGYFAWPLRIISLGSLTVLFLGLLYWKGLLKSWPV